MAGVRGIPPSSRFGCSAKNESPQVDIVQLTGGDPLFDVHEAFVARRAFHRPADRRASQYVSAVAQQALRDDHL